MPSEFKGLKLLRWWGRAGRRPHFFNWRINLGGLFFVTTTTHLHRDQLVFADRHFEIQPDGILPDFGEQIPDGVSLFTGGNLEDQRVSGLSALQFRWFVSSSTSSQDSVIN